MKYIQYSKYLEFLAKFGVSGAHPGGMTLTKELLKSQNIRRTMRILDVGCGTGQTAAYLASSFGAKVTGIDSNPIMIEKAKLRMARDFLPVEILQCSIEEVPMQDEEFDLVLCESVLSFVDKPTALNEIFRLLKKGGKLLANEMTLDGILEATEEAEIRAFYGFSAMLTEMDWIFLFEKAGFEKCSVRENPPYLQETTLPEDYQFSEEIEPELYDTFDQHLKYVFDYEGIMGYRIFTCTK